MTKKQTENTAKYLYDISKIIFAAVVLGNLLAWEKFSSFTFIVGLLGAVLTFVVAYLLDGKEE